MLDRSAKDAALSFAPEEWASQGALLNELVSAGSRNLGALESLVLLRSVGIQNASMPTLQRQVSMVLMFSTECLVHAACLQLCSTGIRHGTNTSAGTLNLLLVLKDFALAYLAASVVSSST